MSLNLKQLKAQTDNLNKYNVMSGPVPSVEEINKDINVIADTIEIAAKKPDQREYANDTSIIYIATLNYDRPMAIGRAYKDLVRMKLQTDLDFTHNIRGFPDLNMLGGAWQIEHVENAQDLPVGISPEEYSVLAETAIVGVLDNAHSMQISKHATINEPEIHNGIYINKSGKLITLHEGEAPRILCSKEWHESEGNNLDEKELIDFYHGMMSYAEAQHGFYAPTTDPSYRLNICVIARSDEGDGFVKATYIFPRILH
jgi:hypothetical protein